MMMGTREASRHEQGDESGAIANTRTMRRSGVRAGRPTRGPSTGDEANTGTSREEANTRTSRERRPTRGPHEDGTGQHEDLISWGMSVERQKFTSHE